MLLPELAGLPSLWVRETGAVASGVDPDASTKFQSPSPSDEPGTKTMPVALVKPTAKGVISPSWDCRCRRSYQLVPNSAMPAQIQLARKFAIQVRVGDTVYTLAQFFGSRRSCG